jgi:AhpD family alkylhydroperoxidase
LRQRKDLAGAVSCPSPRNDRGQRACWRLDGNATPAPLAAALVEQESNVEGLTYPQWTVDLQRKRQELAPQAAAAFKAFNEAVFGDGALPGKTKELIAVAVAHVTQCPYCIRGHTRSALRKGATQQELMEAIWVAAEMRAGAAYAHSALALDTMNSVQPPGAAA